MTRPSGATVTTTDDLDGRASSIACSSGAPNVTIGYDSVGERTAMTTSGVSTDSWAYNSLGETTSATRAARTVAYNYDSVGRLATIAYPNSAGTVTEGYDGTSGQWTSVTDPHSVTTSYTYNSDGAIAERTDPGSLTTAYTYDPGGNPTDITLTQGTSTVVADWAYTMTANEQLSAVTSTNVGDTQTYSYNSLNQASGIADTTHTANNASYAYDTADNPTTLGARRQTFNAGNELCTSGPSTSGSCTTTPSGYTGYTYNTNGDRCAAGPAAGSCTPTGSGYTTYTYNAASQLTAVTGADAAHSGAYSYDGDGLRLSKTVNSVATDFTWDEAANLLQDGSWYYIYGPDGLPTERFDTTSTSDSSWLHQDATGSVRLMTDPSGNKQAHAIYTPWGTPTWATDNSYTGPTPNLGYDSQYTDPETGLIYLPRGTTTLRQHNSSPATPRRVDQVRLRLRRERPPQRRRPQRTRLRVAQHHACGGLRRSHAVAAPVLAATDGCVLGHVHGDSGACRGTNVSHDLAVAGAVASVAAITISTGGLGDLAIAGVGLEAIGTGATAFAAGSSIAVAYGDCRAGPWHRGVLHGRSGRGHRPRWAVAYRSGCSSCGPGPGRWPSWRPDPDVRRSQFGVSIGSGIGSLFADQLGGDRRKDADRWTSYDFRAGSNPRSSLLPALPVAVAALVICATYIGLLGTGGGRRPGGGGVHWRSPSLRCEGLTGKPPAERPLGVQSGSAVDASWNGKAGKATISRRART